MITSRKLADLEFQTQARANQFLTICSSKQVEVLVINTYRDYEMQNFLYATGRTKDLDHPKLTNARGGESYHNFRRAFDCCPLIGGKPLWTVFGNGGILLPAWQVLVDAAAAVGLEWAGNWKSFKEYDHFQFTGGKTLAQLRAERERM